MNRAEMSSKAKSSEEIQDHGRSAIFEPDQKTPIPKLKGSETESLYLNLLFKVN